MSASTLPGGSAAGARPPIPLRSIPEIGESLRRGAVSVVELTETYLARIERLDPELHAFIHVRADQALREAASAQRELERGVDRGPLHGIPYAVKDIVAIEGLQTTAGSLALGGGPAVRDAVVVERLREAGAVLLGTLNTHELQFGTTRRFPFGTPRNPWNLAHATGGSSAGSASAVAAGLCAFSIGGDTGASIRTPAALCGVVGLRPTWGLVPMSGVLPAAPHLDTLGPLTRTVGDAALVLAAMRGEASSEVQEPPGDGRLDGLRIGIVEEMADPEEFSAAAVRSVEHSAAILAALGASVEPVAIPALRRGHAAFIAIVGSEAASTYRSVLAAKDAKLDTNTRTLLASAALLPAALRARAVRAADGIARTVLDRLSEFDVLMGATTPGEAPIIGDARPARSTAEAYAQLDGIGGGGGQAARRAYSLAGCAAMSIPAALGPAGLPLGIHLASAPSRETLLFKVAAALEAHLEPIGVPSISSSSEATHHAPSR